MSLCFATSFELRFTALREFSSPLARRLRTAIAQVEVKDFAEYVRVWARECGIVSDAFDAVLDSRSPICDRCLRNLTR